MKRGVEAGDGWQLGQPLGDGVKCGQRLGLVQRSEIDELPQLPLHLRIDRHRLAKVRAAMHDPVADRVGRTERGAQGVVQLLGIHACSRCVDFAHRDRSVVLVEQRQLEAA